MMCVCLSGISHAQTKFADFHVVPLPQKIELPQNKGDLKVQEVLKLNQVTTIVCDARDGDMMRNARFLAGYVEAGTGLRLPVNGTAGKRQLSIRLALNRKFTAKEGYRISFDRKGIVIEGATAQGVFYGIQTLRKALPMAPASEIAVPVCTIEDAPRFAYRGMHLDVSRHFFGIDEVKRYIDMLALHNMNVFHWHLTDDQGWRLEIKKYPELTEVGAWRDGTVVGRNMGLYDNVHYGGFFTQEEAREVVEYAREHYITVIPEVDMPGHMLAAMTAYPHLGCTGGPYQVERMWGVFDDILCAGKEETFRFVEDVLNEVMQIFPSQYIHIGGDEAPRTRWKACPLCQKRIADEGIKGDNRHSAEDKLQSYFTKRVERYLNEHGRKIIGWDEILDGEVNPSATVMSWRDTESGMRGAEMGHDVIMSPNSILYFDHYQIPATNWSNTTLIGGFSPLEKVYAYEPAPDTLPADVRKRIIGVQANLWTEYIGCNDLLEYMALPRMGALSELQWMQPEHKNYENFKQRERSMLDIYRAQGWKFCDEEWKEK